MLINFYRYNNYINFKLSHLPPEDILGASVLLSLELLLFLLAMYRAMTMSDITNRKPVTVLPTTIGERGVFDFISPTYYKCKE